MAPQDRIQDEALAGPNDIDQLARHLDGLEPARYFDRQADDTLRSAVRRWPLIAAVLRLEVKTSSNA